MRNTALYLTLTLWLLSGSARMHAQSPRPMGLKDCIDYAVQHNSKVQKANLEVNKMEQFVKENLSSGYPQVNLSTNLQYNLELMTQLIPNFFQGKPDELIPVRFGTAINANLGLAVNQLVYSKVFDLGIKASRRVTEVNKLMVTKTKEDLAYDLAKLYYQTQVALKQQNILRANLDQVNGLIRLTELQLKNGFAKKVDLDRLMVNRINLETQIQNLDLQHNQSMLLLKYMMEMPLDAPITLADTIDEKTYPLPAVENYTPQFSDKTDYKILSEQKVLQEMDMARYRAGYFPTVSAFGNYSFMGMGNTVGDIFSKDRWFRTSAVGLKAEVPLFDGHQKKAKIEQIRIGIRQLDIDRNMLDQGLALQFNSALQQLRLNLNNLKALAENRRVSEAVYGVTQNRFREGIAPITEVLTAETAMREAQTNYLSALLQVKLAELELLNINGEFKKWLQ